MPRNLLVSSCVLSVLMTVSGADAALAGRDVSKLRGAVQQLDQIDKRLEEVKNVLGSNTEAAKARAETKFAECADRVTKVKNALAELPAAEPEVKQATERLSATETRIAGTKAEAAGGPRSGTELSNGDKQRLRQVESQLEQLGARLGEIKDFGGNAQAIGTTAVIKSRVSAKFAECDDRLKKSRDLVSSLPGAAPDAKQATARVDEATKRVQDAKDAWAGQAQKSAEETAALKAAVGDGSALEAMERVFTDLFGINRGRGANPELLKAWPPARADFEKFNVQFGESAGRAGNSGAGTAAARFSMAKQAYARLAEQRTAMAKDATARIDGLVAKGKAAVGGIAADIKSYEANHQTIERSFGEAEGAAATYEAMCKDLSGFQPGYPDKVAAARAAAAAELEKFRDKIIAQNVPAANTYAGADRASLEALIRAAWARDRPTEKLLSVRLTGDWARSTGFRWDAGRTAWAKYDHSAITASVYVLGKNPAEAYERTGGATKWHLDGDKVTVGAAPRTEVPPPSMVVLTQSLATK